MVMKKDYSYTRKSKTKFCNFKKEFIDYIRTMKNFSKIINSFWGIGLSKNEIITLKLFIKTIKLHLNKRSVDDISKMLKIPKRRITRWVYGICLPRPARFLQYYIENHKKLPKGWKLLSINSTRGGLFTGPWIYVPEKINNYNTLLKVINQLNPLPIVFEKLKNFSFRSIKKYQPLFFAYLLGVLVGDSRKYGIKRKGRTTRRIGLSLTKRYLSNKRFGEFVTFCALSLGLRMKKIKDENYRNGKYSFFRWSSQCSALFEWIYNVCLGLKEDQLTTYTPIKANWILTAPREFKIWFLQGLADSDGYVDFNSFQAGIISTPNTKLIKNLIESLNVKCSVKKFKRDCLEAVVMSINDAYKIPLFSPIVKSYRYIQMEKLATAKRLKWHMPKKLRKKIEKYLIMGLRGSTLVKVLLEKENIRIRTKSIRRLEKNLLVCK